MLSKEPYMQSQEPCSAIPRNERSDLCFTNIFLHSINGLLIAYRALLIEHRALLIAYRALLMKEQSSIAQKTTRSSFRPKGFLS